MVLNQLVQQSRSEYRQVAFNFKFLISKLQLKSNLIRKLFVFSTDNKNIVVQLIVISASMLL